MNDVNFQMDELRTKIRPIAVSLVDAFDLPDVTLQMSALGCYDGQVYTRLMEAANKPPLNQKNVPDAFHKYLKPFMKSNV